MKSLLFAGIFSTIATVSSPAHNTKKNMGYDNYKLKGTWKITSIDYDKTYKIKPFDEGADIECFVGSQWTLIPNNNTGSYSISGENCPNITTPFRFNVTADGKFAFKKVSKGIKAKTVTAGYFLQLQNQAQNSFDMLQIVGDSSSPVNVVYHFQKIN
ncbi:lipocalin family protein [Elizabethkingia anophelis]|uniref:lipocalin family protein n=1 Tax=Elizabethkingia anophelis TaxID=1117645 RepID=UPI0038925A67